MSLWKLALGQHGRKPPAKHPKSFGEKNFEGQVKRRLLSAYFDGMPAEEASKFGRGLMTRLLGDNANPEEQLKAELFENDPEFRTEFRELLLDEKRAKIDQMRRKNRGRDGDDDRDEDPMTMFGRELIMEAIEKGRRGNGVMEHAMGALGQVLPALLQLQQGQPITVEQQPMQPALAAPQQEEGVPVPSRKLLDTFTATDIQQLLAIEDINQAGIQAAAKIHEAIDAMSPDQRAGALMGLESALSVPPSFLLIYLSGYKTDVMWKPVVNYLEQHPDHLGKLQAAIKDALSKTEDEDEDGEDEAGES